MGIRTGQQWLDKLNAMTPESYVNGETVTSKIADRFIGRNPA
jgi:4-hydroxyphenylacetate 3-monooxygenase